MDGDRLWRKPDAHELPKVLAEVKRLIKTDEDSQAIDKRWRPVSRKIIRRPLRLQVRRAVDESRLLVCGDERIEGFAIYTAPALVSGGERARSGWSRAGWKRCIDRVIDDQWAGIAAISFMLVVLFLWLVPWILFRRWAPSTWQSIAELIEYGWLLAILGLLCLPKESRSVFGDVERWWGTDLTEKASDVFWGSVNQKHGVLCSKEIRCVSIAVAVDANGAESLVAKFRQASEAITLPADRVSRRIQDALDQPVPPRTAEEMRRRPIPVANSETGTWGSVRATGDVRCRGWLIGWTAGQLQELQRLRRSPGPLKKWVVNICLCLGIMSYFAFISSILAKSVPGSANAATTPDQVIGLLWDSFSWTVSIVLGSETRLNLPGVSWLQLFYTLVGLFFSVG